MSNELDIEALYRRHVTAVYRVCYSFMGNAADAEDATQQTFLKLLDRPRGFESTEHERAWLIVCASNLCRDLLKSAGRSRVTGVDDATLEAQAQEAQSHEAREASFEDSFAQRDAVEAAIVSLPDSLKEVVYLYYYEGHPTARIARMLGTPASTVRNRLRDARRHLRDRLEGGRA